MNPRIFKPGRLFIVMTVVSIFVAACSQATPTQSVLPVPDPLQLTVEALQGENAQMSTQIAELNEILRASPTLTLTQPSTPTPTATMTATPGPTISVPEGLMTATHEVTPNYVFVFDPEEWTIEISQELPNSFLVHKEIEDCTVDVAPQTPPGDLLRYYPSIVGRRIWLVEGYDENDYYIHQDLRLDLAITEDEDCLQARENILAAVLSKAEFEGAPASTAAVAPTQRSALEGFACQNTLPPRLRIGDRALIVAGFLWLREEPLVEEASEIILYQQYAPVEILITGGPTCAEGFVWWEVSVTESGEGGQTFTGYMAESGEDEYYLEVWYLGW